VERDGGARPHYQKIKHHECPKSLRKEVGEGVIRAEWGKREKVEKEKAMIFITISKRRCV